VVAQLGEALHYKPEGCRFDSRWCYWNISLTFFFLPQMALVLIQPLTEISTKNISLGIKTAGA
jgi:hypothetical protein